MKKFTEIVAYEHMGIEVYVEIDYQNKKISLIRNDFQKNPKEWVFTGRGLEYMDG